MLVYAAISTGFIAVTFLFIRNMAKRSLSPKIHTMSSIIISIVLYYLVAAMVVVFGFTL
jgi:predicted transporter